MHPRAASGADAKRRRAFPVQAFDSSAVVLGVAVSLALANVAGFAWLVPKQNAQAFKAALVPIETKLDVLGKNQGSMDKKLGALVAVAGHDTVAPRGSPARPRGAVASSVAELVELIWPRDADPADTACVVAAVCADLAPQAWPCTVAALDALVASAAAALSQADDASRALAPPLNAALAALHCAPAAQPDWRAAEALARKLCASFQAAKRLGASRNFELRAATTLRKFAMRAVASGGASLDVVLAAMDDDKQPTLPFALLMQLLSGNSRWQELEFDGVGPATFRNGVLTLRLHESKSGVDEGAWLYAPACRCTRRRHVPNALA